MKQEIIISKKNIGLYYKARRCSARLTQSLNQFHELEFHQPGPVLDPLPLIMSRPWEAWALWRQGQQLGQQSPVCTTESNLRSAFWGFYNIGIIHFLLKCCSKKRFGALISIERCTNCKMSFFLTTWLQLLGISWLNLFLYFMFIYGYIKIEFCIYMYEIYPKYVKHSLHVLQKFRLQMRNLYF